MHYKLVGFSRSTHAPQWFLPMFYRSSLELNFSMYLCAPVHGELVLKPLREADKALGSESARRIAGTEEDRTPDFSHFESHALYMIHC